MGGFSIVHWVVVLAVMALLIYPVARILRRAGYSGWFALLSLVPFVNWIMLWVFAFSKWPIENRDPSKTFE